MTPAPVAVFWFVFLAMRVAAPVAVFNLSASKLSSEKQTNCCVRNARGETKKVGLPFCRSAPRIASIRCGIYRLRVLDERKADKCKCN